MQKGTWTLITLDQWRNQSERATWSTDHGKQLSRRSAERSCMGGGPLTETQYRNFILFYVHLEIVLIFC